jgi:prephenate dehydrogenase
MVIGIVGLGLIGGTYAKSLAPYGYEIIGIDIDPDAISYALDHHIITRGGSDVSTLLPECDVVFLCLYPQATVEFVRQNLRSFKRGAIVSDVVGIKRSIIDQLSFYQDDDILEFVFAHPIAGREKIGVKYSDQAIFQNSNFVIVPTKTNKESSLLLIETLARQMGFRHVSYLKDHEHDDIIAYTSQLTHAIAISLVNSDNDAYDTGLFIGDSYKDLTRIAMINEPLWAELFLNNRDFLARRIQAFEDQLDLLKNALKSNDKDELIRLMRRSTERRGRIS